VTYPQRLDRASRHELERLGTEARSGRELVRLNTSTHRGAVRA
jgi:hypothetical protein